MGNKQITHSRVGVPPGGHAARGVDPLENPWKSLENLAFSHSGSRGTRKHGNTGPDPKNR